MIAPISKSLAGLARIRFSSLADIEGAGQAGQCNAGLEINVLRVKLDTTARFDLEYDIQQVRRIDQA